MNLLIHFVGLITVFAYAGIGFLWVDGLDKDENKFCFLFSAISIYIPFIIYSVLGGKSENYVKVTAIFFSSFAAIVSISLFYLINTFISYKVFWTFQIVIWLIVILLTTFSLIAVKGVRG